MTFGGNRGADPAGQLLNSRAWQIVCRLFGPQLPTACTIHQLRKIMNTVSQCEKKNQDYRSAVPTTSTKDKEYLSDITVHTVRVKINKKGNVKDSRGVSFYLSSNEEKLLLCKRITYSFHPAMFLNIMTVCKRASATENSTFIPIKNSLEICKW